MKVALVGLGSIGQRHYRNLRALGVEQISVFRTGAGNTPFIERFIDAERPTVVRDFTEALAGADAAVIANPTSLHGTTIRAAVERGVRNIFVEKPIGHDLAEARSVSELASRIGARIFVGYHFRFHPLLQRLRRVVAEGSLGRVLSASVSAGEYLPDWHPWEDYRASYAARRSLGGGVILTQSHDLDYLYWFFGAPIRVAAAGGARTDLGIDVEDTVDALVEFPGISATIHTDYYQKPPERVFEVRGLRGSARWDYHGKSLTLRDRSGSVTSFWEPPHFDRNTMYLDELRDVMAGWSGGASTAATAEDGVRVLELCEAVKHSLATNSVIRPSDLSAA